MRTQGEIAGKLQRLAKLEAALFQVAERLQDRVYMQRPEAVNEMVDLLGDALSEVDDE